MGMTVQQFHREFRQHFPDLGFPGQYLCQTAIIAAKAVRLDVIKLDTVLEVPDGKSTADVVEARYGAAAVSWVRRAM